LLFLDGRDPAVGGRRASRLRLFVPHIEMRSKINELRGLAGSGALTVLSREDSIRLMGPDGRWLVHALCIYDLADGPMTINAVVPNSYWSMTMYSAGGETLLFAERPSGRQSIGWTSCSGSQPNRRRPTTKLEEGGAR
jgi:hypothetical protein